PYPVRCAVIPVISKLLEDEEQHPAPPLIHRHGHHADMPDGVTDDEDDNGVIEDAGDGMTDGDDEGEDAFPPRIGLALEAAIEHRLGDDGDQEERQKPDGYRWMLE